VTAISRKLKRPVDDVVATALGAAHRDDPVEPGTGGPAGNAELTAWLGLVLLVAFAVEGFTLLSVRGMISLHIFLGAALIPLVVVKTATTGWRIARYYLGSPAYRQAGPPPLLLRILGPLVVVTGLAVVGSGLALSFLGAASYDPLVHFAGISLDALTLHKASFIAWFVVTTAHVLTRALPALQLAGRRRQVPGLRRRAGVLVVVLGAGAAMGFLGLAVSGAWTGSSAWAGAGR